MHEGMSGEGWKNSASYTVLTAFPENPCGAVARGRALCTRLGGRDASRLQPCSEAAPSPSSSVCLGLRRSPRLFPRPPRGGRTAGAGLGRGADPGEGSGVSSPLTTGNERACVTLMASAQPPRPSPPCLHPSGLETGPPSPSRVTTLSRGQVGTWPRHPF